MESIKVGWNYGMNGRETEKRVDALSMEGRRARPRLRWEDCVKTDLMGGERRMRARDIGEGKWVGETAVKQDH